MDPGLRGPPHPEDQFDEGQGSGVLPECDVYQASTILSTLFPCQDARPLPFDFPSFSSFSVSS